MLSKLNLRGPYPQLPFDMVRCTLDGMVQFTAANDFEGYFPAATEVPTPGGIPALLRSSTPSGLRMPMDPVSIWLLFRGPHTAFTHFDLNDPRVRSVLEQRIHDWRAMVDAMASKRYRGPPITFLRTAIAQQPADEIRGMERFLRAFDSASATSDARVVLALHDQGPVTECIGQACGGRCSVWHLAFDLKVAPDASLFDRCHDGYEKIIALSSSGDMGAGFSRRLDEDDSSLSFRAKDHLSRVEGVPAFRGTCTGFGSTITDCLGGVCAACGDTTGHQLSVTDRARFDSARPWTDDEDSEIGMILVDEDSDFVALVEHVAGRQKRSAAEVMDRLKTICEEAV